MGPLEMHGWWQLQPVMAAVPNQELMRSVHAILHTHMQL